MNITVDVPNFPGNEEAKVFPQTTEDVKAFLHLTIVRNEGSYKVKHCTCGVGDLDKDERDQGNLHALSASLLEECETVLDAFGVQHRKPKFSIGDTVRLKAQKEAA